MLITYSYIILACQADRLKPSVGELIKFKLYLLKFLEESLQLYLVEIDACLRLDCSAVLLRIRLQVESELDQGCTDVLLEDVAFFHLAMVQSDLVILLHLGVVKGHI